MVRVSRWCAVSKPGWALKYAVTPGSIGCCHDVLQVSAFDLPEDALLGESEQLVSRRKGGVPRREEQEVVLASVRGPRLVSVYLPFLEFTAQVREHDEFDVLVRLDLEFRPDRVRNPEYAYVRSPLEPRDRVVHVRVPELPGVREASRLALGRADDDRVIDERPVGVRAGRELDTDQRCDDHEDDQREY